jgi:signal transduction histidine kinase
VIPRALYGLRARLVGALLLTSAVTLAVVAVTLLSPLEHLLRSDRLDALTAAAVAAEPSFERLSESQLKQRGTLLVRSLGRRTGAEVTLLDGSEAVITTTDPDESIGFGAIARVLRQGRVVREVVDVPEGAEARVAVPLHGRNRGLGILLRASLEETQTATEVVRRALVKAMLVGLAVALLVGLALATRLAGRLRRLRDTALRVSELGPTIEMRADSTRDEVGDLTRALMTMQSRLQQQERARRTFVSTASHELRTPLASLQLMLGMLREDLSANEPDVAAASREVARAEAQTDRLSRLSADLLDLSRIDAGVPLRRETVELGELSRVVAGEFGAKLEEERRDLELVAPDPCWALADPVAVARIVRILVDNALKFSRVGEPVEIAVTRGSGGASVSVSDRGPGVPPTERETVFERFSRGSSATDGGFGLGLAIARDLARRMGGDLRIDEAEEGARFTLLLPLAPSPSG